MDHQRRQETRAAGAGRALALAVVVAAAGSARAATYAIDYKLPHAGKVSLAVYGRDGAMVRELLRAVPQGAGNHTLIWDGLDRAGRGVSPGTYDWKLLQTQGLSARYL